MSQAPIGNPETTEYPAHFNGYVSLVPENDVIGVLELQHHSTLALLRSIESRRQTIDMRRTSGVSRNSSDTSSTQNAHFRSAHFISRGTTKRRCLDSNRILLPWLHPMAHSPCGKSPMSTIAFGEARSISFGTLTLRPGRVGVLRITVRSQCALWPM